MATSVWMGAPKGKVSMRNVGGIRVFGGSYPARIWRAYMEKALEGTPAIDFQPPDEKAFAKGECLAVTVERSLLRSGRNSSTRGLGSPTGSVGGRGFSVAGAVVDQVVNGPIVPKATSRTATRGRTCADYLGGASSKKTKSTRKRQATRATTQHTFVPVQVANPVDSGGDLPPRAVQTTPPPVVAVTPGADTPAATSPPAASPPEPAAASG